MRIVVVLGYSDRRGGRLHPICAARVETAAALASEEDTVVLTGRPEAKLMREAWRGASLRLLCDSGAGVTAESARYTARVVRDLGADEVVVVTSWWHCWRTGLLFRSVLRGTNTRVRTVPAPSWTPRLLAREAAAVALLPLQLRRARAHQ
ncbi:MAG TPA: YdcF family protein [Gaiellaceae bacterium]